MDLMIQLSILVICLFIMWRIYKVLQANPELLSRKNLSKSFGTAGFLALLLIGFVVILVMTLKF